MKEIRMKALAKINLGLDVVRKREDGYHEVRMIMQTVKLYDQIVDRYTPIRRVNVSFNHVVDELCQQYDLFTDPAKLEREHQLQKAMLDIKEKFGKNAILKGMNLQKNATTMERNQQIGGHKSGMNLQENPAAIARNQNTAGQNSGMHLQKSSSHSAEPEYRRTE